MTAILGISAFYHDAAAALVVDGQVVAAAQEERFSRIKHDPSFPSQAITFCLDHAGLEIEDLAHVVFYEKPFLKFERILQTQLAFAPRGFKSFATSMPIWLKTKLHLSRAIRKGLNHRYRNRIAFPEHHQSHAASAFFPSPFQQAAILTVDGVGEWATTTLGVGNGNEVELVKQLKFPNSLGLLYAAFTAFCGFRVNSGEGKLMGLAPYGTPNHVDTIFDQIVDVKPDGSIRLNQNFFNYCAGDSMTSSKFDSLFGGPPRLPDSPITQREKDLAASIQVVTEVILLKMVNYLHELTGMQNLCIAGGVGLNCVANGRIIREGPFKNVWIQPASGDSGGSIGAALLTWYQLLGNDRLTEEMHTPFLGPGTTDEKAKDFFNNVGAVYHEHQRNEELFAEVTDRLEAQEIVGWFQGRMEFGPRALGNRSILADPRSNGMQDRLNHKIKFRESFRPFAPVVIAERCQEWFGIDRPSPYMLVAASVNQPTTVPAITHVDGSARIQTITNSDTPMLSGLLKQFEQKTGCPILVNTSFNVRGEPIVCSAKDAYECFLNSDMDVLVVGSFLLTKSEQPQRRVSVEIATTPKSVFRRLSGILTTATYPIRWLLSKVALTLVFFLLVTPIALATRKLNQRSFPAFQPTLDSYWQPYKQVENKTQYLKQY